MGDEPDIRRVEVGMGRRQARSAYGHIYDHFSIDYEYETPNGTIRRNGMCRQINGTFPKRTLKL